MRGGHRRRCPVCSVRSGALPGDEAQQYGPYDLLAQASSAEAEQAAAACGQAQASLALRPIPDRDPVAPQPGG